MQESTTAPEKKTEIIRESAIHYLGNLFDSKKEFTTEILEDTLVGCKESVQSMVNVIKDYKITDIQEMIAKLSFHDFYTYDHSINVSMYCIGIYRVLHPEASNEEVMAAGLGGLLHDLGKVKIPTTIINKPGKLSDEEFQMIKMHPEYGKALLTENPQLAPKMGNLDLTTLARIMHEHHENYNGTGYPQKLSGEAIHEIARIVAIADYFDAITTKRSYHEVLKTDEALDVMEKSSGKKIDPNIFESFKKSVSHIKIKKTKISLPEDFDPCQPRLMLPFKFVDSKFELADKNFDFGKVIIQTDKEKKTPKE